ncbi:unnamed protein product, partial [Iphiclides podalirius]
MDPEEEAERTAFAPRKSLARTPPHGLEELSRPRSISTGGEKRMLTSPEETGSASQRPRVEVRRCRPTNPAPLPPTGGTMPPIAGILTTDYPTEKSDPSRSKSSKLELLDRAQNGLQYIMGVVTGPNSKLNKGDINSVGVHVHDVLTVVAALNLRLSEVELDLAEARLKVARAENVALQTVAKEPEHVQGSYAAALKISTGGAPVALPTRAGPVLAFYPTEAQAHTLRTADDTKAELKKAIRPEKMEIQIEKVRKVGNAGVVVQTTSVESAARLKSAVPPTLRVSEPKKRTPQVALRILDEEIDKGDILKALAEQNFKNSVWTAERLQKSCQVYKRKGIRGTTTAILECSAELRQALMDKECVYIEPVRFRESGVCWAGFRAVISSRMGCLNAHKPPSQLADEFTRIIVRTAYDCLGTRKPRKDGGYEWWNDRLEAARKKTFGLRTIWQRSKRLGGQREVLAGDAFRAARRYYRKLMEGAQSSHFRRVAASVVVVALARNRLAFLFLSGTKQGVKSAKAENLTLRGHYTTSRPLEPTTYASALKIAGRAGPTPITQDGPVVAFYSVDEQVDKPKTAEDTKAELKNKVRPEIIKVQVERIRKVGNAGVVVQTTSIEAAEKLRSAAPPKLQAAVSKARPPQVALRNLDGDPESPTEIIAAMYEQNFKGTSWSPEKMGRIK